MSISKHNQDGGSYAIRGFLYQFDKTLLEVFQSPLKSIFFENRQDIDYEDYVMQVKHHSAIDYTPARIRKPILQLLALYEKDRNLKPVLYCYFKNKSPSEWLLQTTDLDKILGSSFLNNFPIDLKNGFVSNFKINFTDDFETQFKAVVDAIEKGFSVSKPEAILYHSIFQSKLLNKSTGPKSKRHISLSELKSILASAEVSIFNTAYSKYLSIEEFLKQIKKKYFAFHGPNIERFERLFVIHSNSQFNMTDTIELIGKIGKKYFRKGKSPQPYICLTGISKTDVTKIKGELFDHGKIFFDGTHFDGDTFRMDHLTKSHIQDDCFSFKLIPESEVKSLFTSVKVKEVFQFYQKNSMAFGDSLNGIRHVQIQYQRIDQILGFF